MVLDASILTAILGVTGTISVAILAFLAKNVEARNAKEKTGLDALVGAVAEWRAIAEHAQITADKAMEEAKLARAAAEQAERDTISLIEYLRKTWKGFMDGTIPPPLPIPRRLQHLITMEDFPHEGSSAVVEDGDEGNRKD